MRLCACGNDLGNDPGFLMTIGPCQCRKPGKGKSFVVRESFLDQIGEKQYNERTRNGLPVVCEIEKSLFREIR